MKDSGIIRMLDQQVKLNFSGEGCDDSTVLLNRLCMHGGLLFFHGLHDELHIFL